jgi:acyl dehydratase
MVKLSDVEVGQVLKYVYGPVERENIRKYASISGDRNNIHIDDDYAEKMGLHGVIAHGCYSFAMIGECLTDIAGEKGDVINIYGQMRGMVRPGDDWIITLTVISIDSDTGIVKFNYVQESKTSIKIEKDGEIFKEFEANQRGWISEKDIAQGLIKTEETADGTLFYRLRSAIPGRAIVRLEK